MNVFIVVAVLALLAALVVRHRADSAQNARLYSEAAFQGYYTSLLSSVELALKLGPPDLPYTKDGRTFTTSAGLTAIVTCAPRDKGGLLLHVSLSHRDAQIAHEICSQYGFFTMMVLDKNKVGLEAGLTDTGVHHLFIHLTQTTQPEFRSFALALRKYGTMYTPIPFKRIDLDDLRTRL